MSFIYTEWWERWLLAHPGTSAMTWMYFKCEKVLLLFSQPRDKMSMLYSTWFYRHTAKVYKAICFSLSRSAMVIGCRHQYLESWWGTSATLWTKYRFVCTAEDRSVTSGFIHHPLNNRSLVLSQVPSNMALKFADAHNMLLFETSAKDPRESQNVNSIFMSLACRLKAQKSLLYRDVEREDGRVRLTQETETKSTCPCWGKGGAGGIMEGRREEFLYIWRRKRKRDDRAKDKSCLNL